MKKFVWQQIPSAFVSEILCNVGFDGVILDAEHAHFTSESLFSCIQVIKLCNKECAVRFTCPDDILVRVCLDAGIDYAIFSTVEDVSYCEKILSMTRYPRYGGRRGQGLVRENMWGKKELDKSKPSVVAMIETKTGIDRLEEISKFPIDYFLIGTYDLTASLGCVGNFSHPKFIECLDRFNKIVGSSRSGIHLVRNFDDFKKIENDFTFFAFGMDTTVLIDGYEKVFNQVFGESIDV